MGIFDRAKETPDGSSARPASGDRPGDSRRVLDSEPQQGNSEDPHAAQGDRPAPEATDG